MGWFSKKGPVVVARDEVLGEILRDQHGGYTAQMPWRGGLLPVYLMVERESEPAVCIGLVKPVIAQLDTLIPEATAYAARELLATANDWGADSGEPPLSVQALQARFVLESLTVFEDGVVHWASMTMKCSPATWSWWTATPTANSPTPALKADAACA